MGQRDLLVDVYASHLFDHLGLRQKPLLLGLSLKNRKFGAEDEEELENEEEHGNMLKELTMALKELVGKRV
jgi:hypothetical protein